MNKKFRPDKINKPFQMLASWLLGLFAVNGSFLSAASLITEPKILSVLLVVASIINVPLFLYCVFLLQTKFRPEMQEDRYYYQHLKNSKTNEKIVKTEKSKISNYHYEQLQRQIINLSDALNAHLDDRTTISNNLNTCTAELAAATEIHNGLPRIGLNKHLDNYNQIKTALKESNFTVINIFGYNKPEKFLLSYGVDVNVETLQELIKFLIPLGLRYIEGDNTDLVMSEEAYNTVYIGSYAYDSAFIVELTDDISKRLLDPNITTDEFHKLTYYRH